VEPAIFPRELRSPERAIAPPVAKPSLEWLRQLALLSCPCAGSPSFIRFLEFFRTIPRARAIMSVWLRKMGRYRAIIERNSTSRACPAISSTSL